MLPPQTHTCPCDPNCPKGKILPNDSSAPSYFEKLIRYIPTELVAAYLALDGILKEPFVEYQVVLYWIVFLALLILTPLYVIYRPINKVSPDNSLRFHAVAAAVAFVVWVFALGGPFVVTWPELYRPVYGSILLVVTTLTIPVIEKVATKVRFFR